MCDMSPFLLELEQQQEAPDWGKGAMIHPSPQEFLTHKANRLSVAWRNVSVIVSGHLALKGQPLIIIFILGLIGARSCSWHFHVSAQWDPEESGRVLLPTDPILQPCLTKTGSSFS